MPEPDLTAELDAAEDIVTGRVASVETQWGVRRADCIALYGASRDGERRARRDAASAPGVLAGTLICRTVTYGPWEAVGGA